MGPRVTRRRYIDWARGLAILVMIEAHTVDAWTRAADRNTIGFRNARILGGLAAPLFLWLAGVAVVLAAEARARRHGSRGAAVAAACRRGLEVFILAFLFRIQAFLLSPGSDPLTLFRVDILNIMGPAIAAAGLVWGLTAGTGGLVASYAVITAAFAMLTPIVRTTTLVDALPVWIQWYLRPAGEHTTFTSFPWAGFVFAGGAAGALLAAASNPRDESRVHAALVVTGAGLVAFGFYAATLPSIYAQSSFWTSSPAYFAIRVGIMMVVLSAMFGVDAICHESTETRNSNSTARAVALSWQTPLATLGRSSLFVYWIHVELVYGYASWLWRGRLPLWGALVGCAVFTVAMYGVVLLRDRFLALWRGRRLKGGTSRPLVVNHM